MNTVTKGLWVGVDPGSDSPPVIGLVDEGVFTVVDGGFENEWTPEEVAQFIGEMEVPLNNFIKFTQDNHLLTQDVHNLRSWDISSPDPCPCRACGNFNKTDGSYPCRLQIECPDMDGSATCPTCPLLKCEHYTNCVVYDGLG